MAQNYIIFSLLTSGSTIWKVVAGNRSQLVHTFPDGFEIARYLKNELVENQQGTFFCTLGTNQSFSGSALWRLSKLNSLNIIADGCFISSLRKIDSKISFTNREDVWLTDGTSAGEVLVVNRPGSANSYSFCVANENLFALLEDDAQRSHKLVKISSNMEVMDYSLLLKPLGQFSSYLLESCSKTNLLVYGREWLAATAPPYYKDHYTYMDLATGTSGNVSGLASGSPVNKSTSLPTRYLVLGKHPYLLIRDLSALSAIMSNLLEERQ